MKKNKVVIVYEEGSPWIPEDPEEFMRFWDEKISQIPKEFKSSAKIEIETRRAPYDDSSYISVTISYERLETEKEMTEREIKEREINENIKRRELQQLENLRKKYNI
jgi:hypothetical protein